MRSIRIFRKHALFFCVFLLCFFLRGYKLSVLTGFGRDQGIDFATVQQMITDRKPTLLGIKVSIADFHQGPIYLYILLPFFLIMRGDPIAGPYAAIVVSLATITVLYLLVTRFFGKTEAILSTVLFAVSPEFVREGNTPLYQHFLPLFLLLALYCHLQFQKVENQRTKHLWSLCLGIAVGLCLELHFLAITFAVAILLFFMTHWKTYRRYLISFLIGGMVGVSPTILFELRHQFLNTHLFWQYLTSNREHQGGYLITETFEPWIGAMTHWFGADQTWLGVLLFVLTVVLISSARFKRKEQHLVHQLLIVTSVLSLFFQLIMSQFEAHYLLPNITLVLIFISVWVGQWKTARRSWCVIGILLICVLNFSRVVTLFSSNHGYSMPNGWSLQKMKAVSSIIVHEEQPTEHINVASLLDGDTRAYPLRYLLDQQGVIVDSVETYPESKILYILSTSDRDSVNSSTVWEIASMQPFKILRYWDMGDGVFLYKAVK